MKDLLFPSQCKSPTSSYLPTMKKVLITGASGLVGRALVAEFNRQSWEVLGLAYSRAGGALKKVDLTDEEAVTCVIKEFKVGKLCQ